MDRSSEESLAALNKEATWGGKKNSSGNTYYWKGAKFHLDMTDNGLPVIAIYTGADVHDWQLAIPIEQITSSRIKYCYTVMDSVYNSCVIEEFIKNQGHVPIIDPKKPKGGVKIPLVPAKKEPYKISSSVERTNSHLKDSFLPNTANSEQRSGIEGMGRDSCFREEVCPEHRKRAFSCKRLGKSFIFNKNLIEAASGAATFLL